MAGHESLLLCASVEKGVPAEDRFWDLLTAPTIADQTVLLMPERWRRSRPRYASFCVKDGRVWTRPAKTKNAPLRARFNSQK
jgi:hypothetical protein